MDHQHRDKWGYLLGDMGHNGPSRFLAGELRRDRSDVALGLPESKQE